MMGVKFMIMMLETLELKDLVSLFDIRNGDNTSKSECNCDGGGIYFVN